MPLAAARLFAVDWSFSSAHIPGATSIIPRANCALSVGQLQPWFVVVRLIGWLQADRNWVGVFAAMHLDFPLILSVRSLEEAATFGPLGAARSPQGTGALCWRRTRGAQANAASIGETWPVLLLSAQVWKSAVSLRTRSLRLKLRISSSNLMPMERRPARLLWMCTLIIVKWRKPPSIRLQKRALACTI